MATYQIEINDEAINEQIQNILNGQTNKSLMIKYRGPSGEISAAVDVRPVVRGHFGKHTSPFTAPCSECGTSMNTYWNYCPNCGADMRKDGDGNA